jgi:hypothetical protein
MFCLEIRFIHDSSRLFLFSAWSRLSGAKDIRT